MKTYSIVKRCFNCSKIISTQPFAIESQGYRFCFIFPPDVKTHDFLEKLKEAEIVDENGNTVTYNEFWNKVEAQKDKPHRLNAFYDELYDYYLQTTGIKTAKGQR